MSTPDSAARSQPSPQARRAAEIICESAGALAITHDSPDPEDVAEIIERETGIGEITSLVRELCGDHVDWLVAEYHESTQALDPIAALHGKKAKRLQDLLNKQND